MRTQTEEIRGRIVEAAYESFWRQGFRRSSVDSIAERAGLTKRTVYAYFRSKDDLLAVVMQRYEELAAERLEHIGKRLPADRVGLVDSLFVQLSGWASTTPRWSGSGFTRLVERSRIAPRRRRNHGSPSGWQARALRTRTSARERSCC